MAVPSIVLYHDISEAPTAFEAELGVTTKPDRFSAQLEHLEKNYDFIDIDILLSGNLPRRPLLLTFDDCYYSVLEVSRDILAPRGIPAVLFTNPDLLDTKTPSLDHVLSWYANHNGQKALLQELKLEGYPTVGTVLSQAMAYLTAAERRCIRDHLMAISGITQADLSTRSKILTPEDLRTLITLGVEIGNHTANHVHCRSLTKKELQSEIIDARRRLEELCNRPVRVFSMPYGNEADLTPSVLNALRISRHQAIFLVHARSNRFRPASDIWYRTSLHDEEPTALTRKLHFLPLLRSIKAMLRQ